jgi:hypothetical protein
MLDGEYGNDDQPQTSLQDPGPVDSIKAPPNWEEDEPPSTSTSREKTPKKKKRTVGSGLGGHPIVKGLIGATGGKKGAKGATSVPPAEKEVKIEDLDEEALKRRSVYDCIL